MKTFLLWAVGLFGAFILFGFAARSADPNTASKDRAREAIDMCQKAQDDPLAPLGQRQFVRNTCDGMRNDFKTQYGVSP